MRRLAQFLMLLAIGLFFVGCSTPAADDTSADPVVETSMDDGLDADGDATDDADDSDGADDGDGTE